MTRTDPHGTSAPPEWGEPMDVMQSGRDVIHSETQRRLLDCWIALRALAPLPVWRGLNADVITVPFDSLAWLDVVESAGDARFRIGFHGTRLVDALHPIDCIGRFVDDVLPAAVRAGVLMSYRAVLASKGPVYTVSDMRDRTGRIVHHERLLLPFTLGNNGEAERILASVEARSPEGPFELRHLMRSPMQAPVIALCTTIQY